MTDWILTDLTTPGVMILTLNRPDKRNALSIELMNSLLKSLEQAEKNHLTRVLLLKGSGSIFCAGLDLEEARNPSLAEDSSSCVAHLLERLHATPLITIALAQGAAIAGGAGLLAACDFAIGTPEMKIGFPEVKRGLIPALISTLLIKQVSWRKLRELFFLGESISGTEAVHIGLLNEVVSEMDLQSTGLKLAHKILEGAPQAVRLTKELLNTLQDKHLTKELSAAHDVHLKARASSEALEGIRAFQENRKPIWESHE